MSNRCILGSTAIKRMPVTQNPQVPYGSQNHIPKGNLTRIPNSPSKKKKKNFYVLDLVTFCTTLNTQKGYLQILLKIFLVKAKIVLYNIV